MRTKINNVYAEAKGYWKRDIFGFGPMWDINYSTILTKLIQETDRLCDQYASDLFEIWKTIDRELGNPDFKGGLYGFGLREQGVDNIDQIQSKLDNRSVYGDHPYRAVYLLNIVIKDDEIMMTLGKN